jgi:hypothetical protein
MRNQKTAAGGGVAPTLVQFKFNMTGADTTLVDTTFDSNVTTDNLVVVAAFGRSGGADTDYYVAGMLTNEGGATLGTIAFDSPANINSPDPGTNCYPVGIWSAKVQTGGGAPTMRIAHNFTPWAGLNWRSYVGIFEFSLIDTSGTRVNANNSAVQTTTSAVSTGTAATGGAGLLIAVFGAEDVGGATTIAEDGAWTLATGGEKESAGAGNAIGSIIYRLVSSATTDDGSWSTSANVNPASAVVAYKAATP